MNDMRTSCNTFVTITVFPSRLGRAKAFTIAACVMEMCWVVAVFAPYYFLYITARFLLGMSYIGVYSIGFVYGKGINSYLVQK